MGRYMRRKPQPHPAVLQRQYRTATLAMISDPVQRARYEADLPEANLTPLPRKRGPSKPSGKPLEKHVLASVLKALRRDPRVAQVERTQSGVFREGDRYIRVGTPGKLDVTGLLVGGAYFEIEVKRPGERPNPKQASRIASIKASGGISGYATSAEEALALLP